MIGILLTVASMACWLGVLILTISLCAMRPEECTATVLVVSIVRIVLVSGGAACLTLLAWVKFPTQSPFPSPSFFRRKPKVAAPSKPEEPLATSLSLIRELEAHATASANDIKDKDAVIEMLAKVVAQSANGVLLLCRLTESEKKKIDKVCGNILNDEIAKQDAIADTSRKEMLAMRRKEMGGPK